MKKLYTRILFILGILITSNLQAVDYGDAPSSYLVDHLNDDARHTISGTYLGSKIDEESDSSTYNHYSDMAANNDDNNGVDDEDGVIGIDKEILFSGATQEYEKTLSLSITASSSCRLSAWIDWNINNQWDDSEKVLSDRVLHAGQNTIDIPIPTGDKNSTGNHDVIADTRNAGDKKTYARFRCTTDSNINFWGLANNGEVEDYELEINALGLVRGQIYQDVNFNSTFDAGDIGLSPVEVELLDSNNQVIKTTITDTNGVYAFADLEMNDTMGGTAGIYNVRVKPDQLGVLTDLCTLKDVITIKEANINELNRVAVENFGYVPYGEIGNYVWVDVNGNQIKDNDEPPLSNVRIILNKDNSTEEILTDENGFYKFKKLSPKEYSVKVDSNSIPSIYNRTTTDKYLVNIVPNIEQATEVDSTLHRYEGRLMSNANFGYKPIGVIGDYIWKDENKNSKQDFFEKGIEGVLVTLLDNIGNEVATELTDQNGKYLFTSLQPGTYFIEVDQSKDILAVLKRSTPIDNRIEVTLSDQEISYLDADFGFYGNASIGNYVWKDLNEDTDQGTSEPGIADVTLAIYIDTNENGKIDTNETILENTTTNSDGYYNFTNLEPNSYIVEVTDLNDKLSSYVQTTSSDRINSPVHAITGLQSGQNYTNADFGYKPPLGSIGDCVWNDENMNKLKDSNEEGIENVWVRLESDNGFTQQTQTKKDCTYLFEDLPVDNYRIEIIRKPNDFNYTTNENYKINLGQGENNLNADFGFHKSLVNIAPPEIQPPTIRELPPEFIPPPEIPTVRPPTKPKVNYYNIGDCVWNDQNQDGKQNNGEQGIADVWLKLTGGLDNLNLQTKTDKNCLYEFKNIPSGRYKIEVITPPYNYKPSTTEIKNVTIRNKNNYNIDFGYYVPEFIKSSAPKEIKTNIILPAEIPQTGYNPERAAEGFSASSIFPEINIKNPYYDYVLFLYVEELLSKNNINLEKEISLKDGLIMLVKGLEITEDKLTDNELKELLKTKGVLTPETKFILHEHSFLSPITYERTMLLIARLAGLVNDENKSTKRNWQQNYYNILNERNLIPKNFKNNKNWQQKLNRGDFFSFVYRVIQRKQSETKSYVDQFSFSMPKQNINNIPTRRTLLSHPDNWVEKLKTGAAFFEDKENDRLIVFAHSSNFPGETNPIIRFFGKIFNSLIENVNRNDLISINVNNYKINYRVTEVQKVAGNEISALQKKDKNDLIVFTCDKDPRYRWIIRAKKSRH